MAGSVPPARCHHNYAHLPHRLVPPTLSQCQKGVQRTSVQWHRQQTDGTQRLPGCTQRQSGWYSRVQTHCTIAKSQHPELHPSTTTAYKRWNCQVIRPANCCHLIPSNRFLDGLQRLSLLITQRCRTDPRTPRDLGNASCSQVMCIRILALLSSIHVPCVQAASQVVG